ncbi:glutathione S-transferase family protein [Sneathiella sp. HT1-7]|uniref:glutathione S-transferase family protein n=1 Tax=Sneathiella sp. HT1-7 TaxID=2887192 RepID=UPI001D13E616|nr:glutathione S-transferase family protein [Sneathiella sp. HT1-7]MCC3304366.1 glutathione S-transferase family protein [Sneathiella sp. HT1-7]
MAENVLVIGNKRYSSWSLRGWLAAKLSGMEFEEVLVPLYRPGCHEKLKEVNPAAPPKVPSLKIGDAAVWDTLAICEFLAEQYPDAHLWPEDTFIRAHARSVVAEMHSSFQALREHVPMDLSKKLPYGALPEDVEADIARICEIWRECRTKYSGRGPYLFGEISIADVFFAPVLVRLYSHSVPLDDVCQEYFGTLWALPEFVEWRVAAEKEEWTITDY